MAVFCRFPVCFQDFGAFPLPECPFRQAFSRFFPFWRDGFCSACKGPFFLTGWPLLPDCSQKSGPECSRSVTPKHRRDNVHETVPQSRQKERPGAMSRGRYSRMGTAISALAIYLSAGRCRADVPFTAAIRLVCVHFIPLLSCGRFPVRTKNHPCGIDPTFENLFFFFRPLFPFSHPEHGLATVLPCYAGYRKRPSLLVGAAEMARPFSSSAFSAVCRFYLTCPVSPGFRFQGRVVYVRESLLFCCPKGCAGNKEWLCRRLPGIVCGIAVFPAPCRRRAHSGKPLSRAVLPACLPGSGC